MLWIDNSWWANFVKVRTVSLHPLFTKYRSLSAIIGKIQVKNTRRLSYHISFSCKCGPSGMGWHKFSSIIPSILLKVFFPNGNSMTPVPIQVSLLSVFANPRDLYFQRGVLVPSFLANLLNAKIIELLFLWLSPCDYGPTCIFIKGILHYLLHRYELLYISPIRNFNNPLCFFLIN
jgi:hypothetical protein